MARIFLSRLGFVCTVLLLCSNWALAQNKFYVFKKTGEPFFKIDTPIQRGTVFKNTDTLTLHKLDTVYLINQLGELFELNKPQQYVYSALQKYRKQSDNESFTSKYFSYVWRQFTNQQNTRQQPGVVYREKRGVTLLEPKDSIKMNVPKIEFSWKNSTDSLTTYFHLQDLETKHITKIGTSSNTLILYRDNTVLKPGHRYQWTVSTTPFPDYKNANFNSFKLLTNEAFIELQKEMKTLVYALKMLGFSENDIKEIICLDYKFCDF